MPDAPAQQAAPAAADRLTALELKIDAIYVSVEKTRKYFFWTLVITIVVMVLPLIGMLFAIPKIISSYTSMLGGI